MTYPIGYRGHCFLAIVNGKLMQFASDDDLIADGWEEQDYRIVKSAC